MPDTPTLPFWDAVEARIDAAVVLPFDAEDDPILGSARSYRGSVTGSPAPGYFLFGGAPESDAGFINAPGTSGEYTIHCWARTIGDANRLYRWLKALLLETPIEPDGFDLWDLEISKGRETPDPSYTAWQVPMHIRAEMLDAA